MGGWDLISNNAGAIAVGAASLSSAYGDYQAGLTQGIYAEHNALMSEFDAQYVQIQTETQAALIRVQEKLTLDNLRSEELKALASARAKAGASGFALDEGSNQDVQTDINAETAMNAALIKISTNLDVDLLKLGSTLEQNRLRGEAERSRGEASLARKGGKVSAISTAVSGAAQISTLLTPKKKSGGGTIDG